MKQFAIKNGLLQSDLDCAGYNLLNALNVGGIGFDVTKYGAVGDGVANDTIAIQTALAAIPSNGGVLYFPAGQYEYASTPLVLDRKITVMGDGGVGLLDDWSFLTSASQININNATGTLFDVRENGCMFRDIGLRNTSSTRATSGAGIVVSENGWRTTYRDVNVEGFYIGIDVQEGGLNNFDNCWIRGCVEYGIKLRFISTPDGGDHAITNCFIYTGAPGTPCTAGIRIESGGGTKIVNTKINSGGEFTNGIDLAVTPGIATSDLLICNCSIEGYTNVGIQGTLGSGASWGNILLTANQFLAFGSTPYGIKFDGAGGSANSFTGLMITGHYGRVGGSSNAFIDVANITDLVVASNGQRGFGSLINIGSGVTFARSAVVPPGGTTGQSLKKASNSDYDVVWG